MERLTRKVDGTYVPRNTGFIMGNIACTQKLGKLEELEEKIGMPLDVFMKLSKRNDVVYSVYFRCLRRLKIEQVVNINSLIHGDGFVFIACEYSNDGYVLGCDQLSTAEFNETWFLTRKEAKAKLKEILKNE